MPYNLPMHLGLLLALFLAPAAYGQALNREYLLQNRCPTAINLFIGGSLVQNLPLGANTSRIDNVDAGYWYTDANGGRYTGVGTTRAAFWGENYAIIKDLGQINTGMVILPQHQPIPPDQCDIVECDDASCTSAIIFPPPTWPNNTTPAGPPFHFCGASQNLTFLIEFCPNGVFPPNAGIPIHPNDATKCLDVRGANFANGTPVQIYDCNETNAQKWFVVRGSTKVQLAGTNFCLDAGSSPANGVGLKIWQCFDNLPAQQWFYTSDNRIALENQGQCMDLTNGVLTNGNQIQTWQCTDFNSNQVWNV